MVSATMYILSAIPSGAWYLLITGGCILLGIIGCVPEAGNRIALFIQNLIELLSTRREVRKHNPNSPRRTHRKRSR